MALAELDVLVVQVPDNTQVGEVGKIEDVCRMVGEDTAHNIQTAPRPIQVDVVAVDDTEISGNLMLLGSIVLN